MVGPVLAALPDNCSSPRGRGLPRAQSRGYPDATATPGTGRANIVVSVSPARLSVAFLLRARSVALDSLETPVEEAAQVAQARSLPSEDFIWWKVEGHWGFPGWFRRKSGRASRARSTCLPAGDTVPSRSCQEGELIVSGDIVPSRPLSPSPPVGAIPARGRPRNCPFSVAAGTP